MGILRSKETLIDKLAEGKDKELLMQAKRIDKIDRFLGPLESTLQLYGTPFLGTVGTVIGIAELAFLKFPFVVKYLRHTKDYDALTDWIPKEIFANVVPFGDFIDIHKAYYNHTRNYFEQQIYKKKEVRDRNERIC